MQSKQASRYKKLIESLNDAIYTVDINTLVFTSVNKAAEKLTGYKRNELLRMSITSIIAPGYLPVVKRKIKRKMKKAEATIYEIEIINKKGKRVPIEISSLAIYEEDTPIEILGVARDISERKFFETQRDVFLSMLTHEIKNPLTPVSMYVSLLKKHLTHDEKALAYIATITKQIKTVEQFLNEFMDVSQMRIGKFHLSRELIDINQTIDEVVNAVNVSSHVFKREGKAEKVILADKVRIQQVLTNLISNAMKYSPDGSKIIIKTAESQNEITVSVQDFGEGITEEEQKKIFEPFIRTTAALQKNIKGHGLGLYICREIIRHHKGRLWLESKPLQGSIFYFTLPNKAKKS